MVKKKKKEVILGFKLPKLRKQRKIKIKKVIIKEVKMKKPVGKVLAERIARRKRL